MVKHFIQNKEVMDQLAICMEAKASSLTKGPGGPYRETYGVGYPDPNKY